MMLGVADAVEQGIAHPDVRRSHVNLCAERPFAVGKLAVLHSREQIQVFLDAAIAIRTFLGLAAIFIGLLRRQVANVGLAFFDERDGIFVKLVEVIRGVERLHRSGIRSSEFGIRNRREIKIRFPVAVDSVGCFALRLQAEVLIGPAADEPVDVFGDGVHVLDVFLGRVGVVHAEIADAAELVGDAEVQADALGVADVEITVRLRRKARVNLRIFLFSDVLFDDVADEIGWRGSFFVF